MRKYLECMKVTRGENAHNCRLLAKEYLKCRMDNQLMDQDQWKNLGLPDDASDPAQPSATPGKSWGE